jgi:hypothetical protein
MNNKEIIIIYQNNINKINQKKYLKIKNHGDKINNILKNIKKEMFYNKLYYDIKNYLFLPLYYLN